MTGEGKAEVQWREWSEEAFEEARRVNRPVLLDLSAVWCHWCHVMDSTSYSNAEAVGLINKLYIPIRVDIDRRPDIKERYNLGGFPTTAFLTPKGEILTGGTYIPPQQLIPLLQRVADAYKKRGSTPQATLSESVAPIEKRGVKPKLEVEGKFSAEEVLWDVADSLVEAYDPTYGGFGSQPKFPMTEALDLALLLHHTAGDKGFLSMAVKTLDAMGGRGLYDGVEGGFFRYSVTRDWSEPHYEKMLENNAGLLRNYLHAYQMTGEERFKETAKGVLQYVEATLTDRVGGGFYGSQAADEEYYKLRGEERRAKKPPSVDRTLYADWNGMMTSAFIEAYSAFGEPSYLNEAEKALGRLATLLYQKGVGLSHYYDGDSHLPGLLSDQAHGANALLDAFEATGRREHLSLAEDLATGMAEKLYDTQHGGFLDSPLQTPQQPIGLLKEGIKSIVDNAVAVEVLVRLFHLTDKEPYREMAGKTLTYFTPLYQRYSFFASRYALAADRYAKHPLKIVILSPRDDPMGVQLRRVALKGFAPRRVVEPLDPNLDGERIDALGYLPTDTPTAYICGEGLCSPPIGEPNQLEKALRDMVERKN